MPAKPAPAPAEEPDLHLLQFNNLGWGTKLLVPASLLTRLAELLSCCEVVEETYLPDGIQIVALVGDVDYGLNRVVRKHLFAPDQAQAKAFEAYYRTTYELTPSSERASGVPLVKFTDFLQRKKEES